MGIHPSIREELERNRGLAAMWRLSAEGVPPDRIRHAAKELRLVHQGVLLSGHAPLTDWQRWKAATMTAPNTYLADWSGGTCCGFRSGDRWPTTVVREGEGGSRTFGVRPDRLGSLKVRYAQELGRDHSVVDDIQMLHPARILLDLAGNKKLSDKTMGRYMREALRVKAVRPVDLQLQVARHQGRRGIVRFRAFANEYGRLGLHRSRSDAEALAVSLLEAAGVAVPLLNTVVAGYEADLVRPELRLIVELDGPQYHLFVTEDARKQAAWEQAGWVVRRLWTDAVYDEPHLLLDRATRPVSDEERAVAASTRSVADVATRLDAARSATTVRKSGL